MRQDREGDGGPAFPMARPAFIEEGEGKMKVLRKVGDEYFSGLSIRDYFAAQALQVLLHETNTDGKHHGYCAKQSYLIADAMIEARK